VRVYKKAVLLAVFYILCIAAPHFFGIAVSAQTSVNLVKEAQKAGASFFWDPLSGSGIIEKNGHSLSFREGDRIAMIDNSLLVVTDAPEKRNGIIYVSTGFFSRAQELFSQNTNSEAYYKIGAILIDAGHGGKDPGAVGTHTIGGKKVTLQEKTITLEVSKMLGERLRKAYPDKKILLTRSDDRFLSLEQRVDIANSVPLAPHEAVLYISIHVNASLDKRASGFEVWYLNPGYRRTVLDQTSTGVAGESKELFSIFNSMVEEEYTTESILIAKFVLEGLQAKVGSQSTARGIKQEEWFVVKNANMPSVLVELGFVTNEKEAELLNSKDYLNKATEGIYNGLSAFVSHFEQSRGFTGSR
jgi:N-acetylmuramoyl-L-alanine amidase